VNLTLADVERCLSSMAEEGHETIAITSVQTDSRTVGKGDLFFCIDGEKFDGHEFAAQAAKSGAAGIVASRMLADLGVPVIMVRNTTTALGRLAACWRDTCGAKLVAVTGTAGKTTVKEMLSVVVSEKFTTAKNYRNFNNQIGLPLSMLKADCTQDIWIMELGISVRGDMEELAPIASPDLAVITNVGPGHLEGLGNEAGVALAKTSLLKYLRQSGTAVISQDYPLLWDAARELVDNPVGFSGLPYDQTHESTWNDTFEKTECDYVASFLAAEANGWGRFRLRTPDGDGEITAPFCGDHFAENLACVAAAAHQLGLTREDVIKGISTLKTDSQRFCCKGSDSVLVIDDSYNANPLSMAHSLKTAAKMAGARPLVLVLGDMRELGEETSMRHEELGRLVRDMDPKAFFYKGSLQEDVRRGLNGSIHLSEVHSPEEFIQAWNDLELDEAVVLVKGSRSLKMETFAGALCKRLNTIAGTEETPR